MLGVCLERLALVIGFGLLYVLVFYFSAFLGWNNSYLPGISLLYLPAGVRLLACLIGGVWGGLGLLLAIWWIVPTVWPSHSFWFHLGYALVGAVSTWAFVGLAKLWLGIDEDLHRLRMHHFPMLALVSVMGHSVCLNAYLYCTQIFTLDQLGLRVSAQMFGSFMGSMLLLFVLAAFLYAQKQWSARNS